MSHTLERRLGALTALRPDGHLAGGLKGLEKEGLRVTPDGHVALTPHPAALGSALTHPHITTDFSEALVELVTPPFADVRETLGFLDQLHRFVYCALDEELLWAASMPCMVESEDSVPIARYGTSNVARMKHVYRLGLKHRYGSIMQAIAGIHFNYSLPDAFWPAYREIEAQGGGLQDFRSRCYFDLVRNFHRYGWLISLLYGASPAVCKSFLKDRTTALESFDRGTLYQPYATSLRMSDIGYKSENQAGLYVCYEGVDEYVRSLTRAIETPLPEYERIGVEVNGEYRQLNANLLQIENEFYSFIRPKQIARSGEKPTHALARRGVQYVEVRALDVSPFDPLGANETQLRLVEALLVYCLLAPSPPIDEAEHRSCSANQRLVACCGRDPALELVDRARTRPLHGWALELLGGLRPVCEVLDRAGGSAYTQALASAVDAVADMERLPSSRLLQEMRDRQVPFFRLAMDRSQAFAAQYRSRPLEGATARRLAAEAAASLERQRALEAVDELSFDAYLAEYFDQSIDEPQTAAN